MLNLGNNEELYKDVIFKHNKKSKNAVAEEPASDAVSEPERAESVDDSEDEEEEDDDE